MAARAYDSNNNVLQESGPSGTINYVYNQATQRHTETWTGTDYANAASDIVYGYNNMGELASVTVLKINGQTPAAVASSTLYNAIGGTSTITTTLPNTVYQYDLGGRLTSTFDSATGITTTYTYKPNTNYVSTEAVTNAAGTTLASYTYSYRAEGLKTGAVEYSLNSNGGSDTVTLTWNYDALDRLIQEVSVDAGNPGAPGNYTDKYSYDLNSNRTGETIENGSGTVTDTVTSTYNANDELTQTVDASTGTTTYGYDNNGSQISVTHTPNGTTTPDSTTTNEYDLKGQLAGSQVTTSAGTAKTTYFYDDSGNRIEETNTSTADVTTTTYYLADSQNPSGYAQPIEQAATPGSPQITYIWGAQLISETYAQGATIPGVGTASSPTTYYLFQDAHGSTRLITDANGNTVARYNYDASGNALGFNAATALTTYLYSSMPFDAASGNYYDHARFYNSGTGEFTQADYGYSGSLANPMTDLPYMYGGGDPVNFLDPTGHLGLMDVTVSLGINFALTAGIDGTTNLLGYTHDSVWQIAFDSTVSGILGAVGGPIASKLLDMGVPAIWGILSKMGVDVAPRLVTLVVRAFGLGLVNATLGTAFATAQYDFLHPGHRLSARQIFLTFLTSAAVGAVGAGAEKGAFAAYARNLASEIEAGGVSPAVKAAFEALRMGNFQAAATAYGSLGDSEAQQLVGLAFTKMRLPTVLASTLTEFVTHISEVITGIESGVG